MERDGGYVWDRNAGTFTPFGAGATPAMPAADRSTSGLADWLTPPSATEWVGLAESRCRFNCMLNGVPDFALQQVSDIYDGANNAKDCAMCAYARKTGQKDVEACRKCAVTVAEGFKKLAKTAGVAKVGVDWYFIIKNCKEDCDKDPDMHICSEDKWECCRSIFGLLFGFDVICGTACNKTFGIYAPVSSRRLNCAFGEKCEDGACVDRPKCAGISCAEQRVTTRVARDPNAKAASPGGDVLPGEAIVYTVFFENVGAGAADSVFILDSLDPDLGAPFNIDPRCNYNTGSRVLTCDIGTLAEAGQPGSKGSVSFSAVPTPGLPMGTEIVNQAEVHFPSAFEVTPTNAVVNVVRGLTAVPQSLTTGAGAPLPITLGGGRADGGPVTFRILRYPLFGTIAGSGPSWTYTPMGNFAGGDDFVFVASDGTNDSDPATVTINVLVVPGFDTTPPTVVSTSPANGDTHVLPSSLTAGSTSVYGPLVTVAFSEPMDAASFTAGTLTVSGLAGRVAYDGQARTAIFEPLSAFAAKTTYTATITAGARDAAGNALAAHSWTFKTAAAAAPHLTLTFPANGTSPLALAEGLGGRRQTMAVANDGTADLRVGSLVLAGADPTSFRVASDRCSNQTLTPGATCSFAVELAGTVTPIKSARVDVPSNDPDTPIAPVGLTTTTKTTAAPYSYFFAEGATSTLFNTYVALANPGQSASTALLRFLKSDGTAVTHEVSVPAMTRRTVDVKSVPGLTAAEFSTVVESDSQMLADRTMGWDSSRYGAHAETGIAQAATTWYLAEGATHSGFSLFYLIQNPGDTAAQVEVTYLLASGPPVSRTYTVPANSRFNIWVNNEAAALPSLANNEMSAKLTSTVPIIVERAMYLNSGGLTFGAGHESADVTAPSLNWFLAEGATGGFFDLFVLVANPNSQDSQVTLRFLLTDGTVITQPHTIAANSRRTFWVDTLDPRLADAAVSTTVNVINNVPVIVERAMWWPGPTAATWVEAHNSPGSTVTGTKWGLAEGEVGGPYNTQTYILLANTSASAASVQVTLLFEDGSAQQSFTVLPNSRFNVDVAAAFPAAAGRTFGAIVESTGATPAQIVVERAMYSDALGVTWAAGTNALATRLP